MRICKLCPANDGTPEIINNGQIAFIFCILGQSLMLPEQRCTFTDDDIRKMLVDSERRVSILKKFI